MAKTWDIKYGSRAHDALARIVADGRYASNWTPTTVNKLVAFGLCELADAPASCGWGYGAKTVIATQAGREVYQSAKSLGVVRVLAPEQEG